MYDSDKREKRTEEHRLLVHSDSSPSLKTVVIFLVVLLGSALVFMNVSERIASEKRDLENKRQQTADQQTQVETARRQDLEPLK